LVEGIMFSKPCITKPVGGTVEVIIDNYNGFYVNDIYELEKKLQDISRMSISEYERLSKNAYDYYLKKFRNKTMLEKYENVINNLINNIEN